VSLKGTELTGQNPRPRWGASVEAKPARWRPASSIAASRSSPGNPATGRSKFDVQVTGKADIFDRCRHKLERWRDCATGDGGYARGAVLCRGRDRWFLTISVEYDIEYATRPTSDCGAIREGVAVAYPALNI
jgi:hypothetical protein